MHSNVHACKQRVSKCAFGRTVAETTSLSFWNVKTWSKVALPPALFFTAVFWVVLPILILQPTNPQHTHTHRHKGTTTQRIQRGFKNVSNSNQLGENCITFLQQIRFLKTNGVFLSVWSCPINHYAVAGRLPCLQKLKGKQSQFFSEFGRIAVVRCGEECFPTCNIAGWCLQRRCFHIFPDLLQSTTPKPTTTFFCFNLTEIWSHWDLPGRHAAASARLKRPSRGGTLRRPPTARADACTPPHKRTHNYLT